MIRKVQWQKGKLASKTQSKLPIEGATGFKVSQVLVNQAMTMAKEGIKATERIV